MPWLAPGMEDVNVVAVAEIRGGRQSGYGLPAAMLWPSLRQRADQRSRPLTLSSRGI